MPIVILQLLILTQLLFSRTPVRIILLVVYAAVRIAAAFATAKITTAFATTIVIAALAVASVAAVAPITGIIIDSVAHATHNCVEHLHDEHDGVVVVPEEKKVPQLQVIGTVELLPPTRQVHVALLDHQLHIPLPAKPAAGLSQLHIIWRIFTHQHVHKTVRQPLHHE